MISVDLLEYNQCYAQEWQSHILPFLDDIIGWLPRFIFLFLSASPTNLLLLLIAMGLLRYVKITVNMKEVAVRSIEDTLYIFEYNQYLS